MSGQSKLYIMGSRLRRYLILVTFLLTIIFNSFAKDRGNVIIEPLRYSTINKWSTDVFIFGMGGSLDLGNFFTAINGGLLSGVTDYDFFNTVVDFGITSSFYRNNLLRYNVSIDYMFSRHAINRGLGKSGSLSHWLCLDLGVGTQLGYGLFINGGLKGNVFLHGTQNPSGTFHYEGINNNCYNKFTSNWYIGASYLFKFIKLEIKFGTYMVPLINPNKLAYYNLTTSHIDGIFLEFGAAVMIFSTKSKLSSIIDE